MYQFSIKDNKFSENSNDWTSSEYLWNILRLLGNLYGDEFVASNFEDLIKFKQVVIKYGRDHEVIIHISSL